MSARRRCRCRPRGPGARRTARPRRRSTWISTWAVACAVVAGCAVQPDQCDGGQGDPGPGQRHGRAAVNLTGLGHQGTNQQLYISGGGTVTAVNAVVYGPYAGPSNQFGGDPAVSDLLSIDAGRGSSLTLTGTPRSLPTKARCALWPAAGSGQQCVCAIVAITWDGSGVYQAVGGTWDSVNHVFAVSAAVAASGAAEQRIRSTPGSNQRMLITDTAAHTSVGVSFLWTEFAVTSTGTTVTGAALSSLDGLLPAGQRPWTPGGLPSPVTRRAIPCISRCRSGPAIPPTN